MALPDKDEVLKNSDSTVDPGIGDESSSVTDAKDTRTADPQGSAARADRPEEAGAKEASETKASETILEEAARVIADAEAAGAAEAAAGEAAVAADCDSEGSESPEDPENSEEPTCEDLLVNALQEIRRWQDKYIRLHAEWDTYRRRTTEQRKEEKERATERLVESLLPVIDDFERTIDYAQKNGEAGLLGGVEAVHTKLLDTLQKDGVVIIDPAGEEFDALEHQAVSTVEDKSVPDETVSEVFQKGYRMGKKVLRPAMVTVAIGGAKRPKTED